MTGTAEAVGRSGRLRGRGVTPSADAAFAAALDREHGRALRLAYLLTGHQQTAEDAVADAIVRVFPHWRRGRVQVLGPYLRRAVVNEVRRRGRRRSVEQREAARRTGDHRGTRLHADDVVDRHVLVDALAELPERQRTTVVLRYFDDRSVAETADLMGVSAGTVKSQTAEAVRQLRERLGVDLGVPEADVEPADRAVKGGGR